VSFSALNSKKNAQKTSFDFNNKHVGLSTFLKMPKNERDNLDLVNISINELKLIKIKMALIHLGLIVGNRKGSLFALLKFYRICHKGSRAFQFVQICD